MAKEKQEPEAADGPVEAQTQRMVSPADFPRPSVELTYPAAVLQFQEGEFQGQPTVVLSVIAPDDDGVVRTRHYPMGREFALNLEAELRKARGTHLEMPNGANVPPDLKRVK
jgi:hypothetical protein